MNTIKKLFTLSMALLIIGSTAFSQTEKWTLEKCIQHALENNIQIKQQKLQLDINKKDHLQSKANLLPTLNADASHSFNSGRALDETTYQFTDNETIQSSNFNISSSLTLFSGLQKINSIKRAKLDLMAGVKDLEKIQNDISINVTSAFLQILFNTDILTSTQNQLEVTKLQVERTKKLVDAGSLPQGNLLEIQAQAAQEEYNVVTYQNQLDLSVVQLTQLLELESPVGFEIEVPNITIEEHAKQLNDISSTYSMALSTMPEIASAELNVDIQEKNLQIARGGYYPTLSLSAGMNSRYSSLQKTRTIPDLNSPATARQIGYVSGTGDPVMSMALYSQMISQDYGFIDQFKDNKSSYLGFRLSIPILNGLQTRTRVAKAKIAQNQSMLQLESTKKDVLKKVQQAFYDASAALKKYHSSEKSVLAIKEAFRYTEEKYTVGMVNTLEYNQAKNRLIKAESDLIQAKYEYVFKTNILDFYRGNPISLKQ